MADSDRPQRSQRQRPPKEEKQFDERVLHIDRVARVVKGGRRFRFRALVAVGDNKGKIGIGVAKGVDVVSSISKATDVAKKSMVEIAIYNGTIPHEETGSVGGAVILLKPAAPGTGLIAGGVVRVVLEVAGLQNMLSKSLGSNNKINLAYATVDALQKILPKSKWHTSTNHGGKPKTAVSDKPTAKKPAEKKTSTKKVEKK